MLNKEQHYSTFLFLYQKSAVVLHFDIDTRATQQHFFVPISKKCCSVVFWYSEKSNTTALFCFYTTKKAKTWGNTGFWSHRVQKHCVSSVFFDLGCCQSSENKKKSKTLGNISFCSHRVQKPCVSSGFSGFFYDFELKTMCFLRFPEFFLWFWSQNHMFPQVC